jgi:hypothetical protein
MAAMAIFFTFIFVALAAVLVTLVIAGAIAIIVGIANAVPALGRTSFWLALLFVGSLAIALAVSAEYWFTRIPPHDSPESGLLLGSLLLVIVLGVGAFRTLKDHRMSRGRVVGILGVLVMVVVSASTYAVIRDRLPTIQLYKDGLFSGCTLERNGRGKLTSIQGKCMYLWFRGLGDPPQACSVAQERPDKIFVTNCEIHGGRGVWNFRPNPVDTRKLPANEGAGMWIPLDQRKAQTTPR